MKELHATIGFHLTHCNKQDDFITIDVLDKLSRCSIARIEMSFKDYSKGILTSCHGVPCVVNLNDIGPIGKKREHKDEIVWIPWPARGEKEAIRKAIAEFEVNGWKGDDKDAKNSHRWTDSKESVPGRENGRGGHWVRIGYERWVEPTQEDIEQAAESKW